ncbi:type VII secretion integral membrane protein EccD [Streptoalloteichus hindustanus]|uniref:Type VII secretion integral membrane protein EccD n=1 Tax=Streptoalloteichus hindustanus TaxID=2017 RepID=A0A1M4TDZ2_STRHI|nr:type VII secretion integral membrane protein EccD [Streptoalloteichus hindustanus]SHE42584.1 type VII secretion integral membrane protein EccD [Streptoalloteichus hindustanus]
MATGTTVFSRVTVVAPTTRIDVALPADVAVADLLPMVLDMARRASGEGGPLNARDGGVRHGGWCLAKLGESEPLDPSRTLASQGVVDGELLQLRRRNENPPPPLYDDVVDAIADSAPDSYRPWTTETAGRIGHLAGGLALVGAAMAAWRAGPSYPLATALVAGVAAVVAVVVGAVIARAYAAATTGVVVAAAGGLPLALVSGLYIVPGTEVLGLGRANLLLGSALVLVVATASIMVLGAGVTVFVAAATAGTLGVLAFAVATLVDTPAPGVAAGAGAVALAGLSTLPRLTLRLARLPLPQVPGSAEDLKEDTGFPEYTVIERRTGLAHEYMTGMLVGCGVVAAISAILAATDGSVFGPLFAVALSAVMLMRARAYANGSQAVALLVTGMVAATGVLLGWLWTATPFTLLLWVFGALVLLAATGLVLGVVFPEKKFSPVLRRTADIAEAVLIASVLPLALAVMDLYSTIRHLNINI